MPTQVQCPNCGSYKVSTSLNYIDRITRQKISESKAPGCFVATIAIIATFFIAWYLFAYILVAFFIHDPSSYNSPGAIGTVATLAGVVAVIVGFVVYRFFAKKKQAQLARAIKMNNSYCFLCGYSWEWPEGHPRTDIHVDPDKIQRGERRLEEERLAEKRRQDAMAGWFMQQQRDKKHQ